MPWKIVGQTGNHNLPGLSLQRMPRGLMVGGRQDKTFQFAQKPFAAPRTGRKGYDIFRISSVNMGQALSALEEWIEKRQGRYVCVTPAHAIMDCYRDPGLRRIFNASGMTTPDGMAIVWLLRLYGQKGASRVYGPDLMREVCRLSVGRGWRHFPCRRKI